MMLSLFLSVCIYTSRMSSRGFVASPLDFTFFSDYLTGLFAYLKDPQE